jgi:glycosyltransferase 2 family protein
MPGSIIWCAEWQLFMKLLLKGLVGLALGGVLLVAAISSVDLKDAQAILEGSRTTPLLAAVLIYWCGVLVRVLRWQLLLTDIAPLSLPKVARALVVGYAVNNILPARLGELFRVDYLARRFRVTRSAALGSVILERLFDGIAAVLLLTVGLGFSQLNPFESSLAVAAATGLAILASVLTGVILLIAFRKRLSVFGIPWLAVRFDVMASAMSIVYRPIILLVAAYTSVAWCFEAFAVWMVLAAFGIEIPAGQLCLVFGAAAWSTLLPSAPAYVGSLQVAFVLAFSAIGLAPVLAIVCSTATQLFLFGSITFAGLGVLTCDYFIRATAIMKRNAL